MADFGSASQPADAGGASQPRAKMKVKCRVGTFNVGITQDMLTGRHQNKRLSTLERVVQTLVSEGQLDLLCLCEVGHHKQGFETAGIDPCDLGV